MTRSLIYQFLRFFLVYFVLTLDSAELACAEGIGELGGHITSERSADEGGATAQTTSERHLRFDLAIGWRSLISETHELGYGIVLKSERGFQGSGELSGYSFGGFLSWYNGPISIRLDYIIISELISASSSVETRFRDGSGFDFEARWMHSVSVDDSKNNREVKIGPALSFSQRRYAKIRIGSLPETSNTRTTESLAPGIRLIFLY